ncbi:PLP-dependent aminotransferase family protein [Angustibacter sp. McL0619]|uniref:aminotransferase-like domain-containing protein n=1 Tax=Angustibacter sp. McL0619 TaxID=3415676 RepID=UPI003CED6A60
MDHTQYLARRALSTSVGPIDELFATVARRPDVVSFAAGAPDLALLPVPKVAAAAQRALDRWGPRILQYGPTEGFAPLREACLPLLAARGLSVTADAVHISTGGSGGLATACQALLDEADVVLVERPSYPPAVKVFRSFGAHVVGVPSDQHGIIPGALDHALTEHRPKLVYLMPTFQNPTGRTASAQRRQAVASVLRDHGALAVEDDVYYDLRYSGSALAALAAYAPEHVIYLTSLSKTVAPALRIGIVVPPPALMPAMLALKQGIDMQTSSLTQAIATEALTDPAAPAQLEALRTSYSRKRDLLVSALRAELDHRFAFDVPDGGLFLWLQGPDGFDAERALPAALDVGVAYLPGASCYAEPGHGRSALRLSFAAPPAADIAGAVGRLASVLGLEQ